MSKTTDTLGALDKLNRDFPLPGIRLIAVLIMITLGCGVWWASIAELDEVVTAQGQVVPSDKVKVVQHFEGGIVEELHVRAGQRVSMGDPLLRLDLASRGINLEETRAQMDALILRAARMQAQIDGLDTPDFPAEIAARAADVVAAETQSFKALQGDLEDSRLVLEEQLKQREQQVRELNQRIAATKQSLGTAREQLRVNKDLYRTRLVPRVDVLAAQRDVDQLSGDLKTFQTELPTREGAIEEVRAKLAGIDSKFRSETSEKLSEVQREIARLVKELDRAEEQETRTLIISPIDGVIENLRVSTIGGVVQAGEPILDVVPVDDKMVVEVKIDNADIGYVDMGQPAVIKVATYDFLRFGHLDGEVSVVASNSEVDEQTGTGFYRVQIATATDYLEVGDQKLPITPGMQAEININIGSRSVAEYLVQPVLKLRSEAFRER
ncbi:MAG: HlyD family type I secretion periplasmic adaptor subunit [Alphaproteobacteria bacterium]